MRLRVPHRCTVADGYRFRYSGRNRHRAGGLDERPIGLAGKPDVEGDIGGHVGRPFLVAVPERFVPAQVRPQSKDDPPGPYLLAVTAQGMTLRAPLASYRTESNKLGRRCVKLNEGDKVLGQSIALRIVQTLRARARRGRVDGSEKRKGVCLWRIPKA